MRHHRLVLLAATDDDVPFLRDCLLVEAAYPNGTRPPGVDVDDDHIVRYIEGWGRPGDLGLVAWSDGEPVGAAWTRLMAPERPGYGFVDPETPELTVAVVADRRGQGLGRALVAGAVDLAGAHGHRRVSLSVADAVNPVAVGLYRSLGFAEVGRDEGGSLTMVAPTAPPPPASDGPTAVARRAEVDDGPALARLREVMFTGDGLAGRSGWVAPFLTGWAAGAASGTWRATVIDDERGRPVASALAVQGTVPPAPGRERGRTAHIGSVATEPAWRRLGCARAALTLLVADLDDDGMESTTLNATADGEALYASLGFSPSGGVAMRRPSPASADT